jgi:hypothetical protein
LRIASRHFLETQTSCQRSWRDEEEKIMKDKLLTSFLFAAVFLALGSTALATTTWYVNGVNGSNSNNCLSATSGCKTIGHTISLAASGDSIKIAAATYTEHLIIGISLKVIGSGSSRTIIDGRAAGIVVTISSAAATVTLSNVTIRNGYAVNGGGINNAGTLTINSSTITGNSAHPIGGGIYNSGALKINNSTLSANHAGPLSLQSNRGLGGGISNHGTLTVSNSTLSGNYAGVGGGINIYGGTAALQNSIVANSPSGGNCAGTVTSNGYNLSSDDTCNFTNTGDLNNTDSMLGPLQYNGGPTQTMALPLGSPAVDAGNPNGCTDGLGHLLKTDQRGKPRPDAQETAGCDIGAYEYQGAQQAGHCVFVCGSTRCGMLTGYCVGSVNGACRRTYDPFQCPAGKPAGGSGSSCGEVIDTTRTCTP